MEQRGTTRLLGVCKFLADTDKCFPVFPLAISNPYPRVRSGIFNKLVYSNSVAVFSCTSSR